MCVYVYDIYIIYRQTDIHRSEHMQGSYHHHYPRPSRRMRMTGALLQTLWLIIWGHCVSFPPVQAFLALAPAQNRSFPNGLCSQTPRQTTGRFLWLPLSYWFQLLNLPTLWGHGSKGGKGSISFVRTCLKFETILSLYLSFLQSLTSILLNHLPENVKVQAWEEYKPHSRVERKTYQ